MSKDKNNVLDLVVKDLLPYFQAGVNCTIKGTVVSLSWGSPMRADVQPLPEQSDGTTRALLGDCLVTAAAAEYLRDGEPTRLKRGDTVIVAFDDRDQDNFTGSGQYALASRRMHSINDGTVLAVIR